MMASTSGSSRWRPPDRSDGDVGGLTCRAPGRRRCTRRRNDAQSAQGLDDAAGDLAAVGDEDGAEQGGAGCGGGRRCDHGRPGRRRDGRRRKIHGWLTSGTGRRRSPAAGCCETSSASPRTLRVSAGSITPSSRGGPWSSRGCPGSGTQLDRGPERLLVRGRPLLPACLVLVAFDRGEHADACSPPMTRSGPPATSEEAR